MTSADGDLVPILMYHSVAEEAHAVDRPFTVRPAELAHQVEALCRWGARTITVADYGAGLAAGRRLPPRTVIITVDDAYANTANTLLPILAEAGLKATVFVSTGMIGTSVRGTPMISWAQLHELRAAGFEVAAHGHRHIALDVIPPHEAYDEMVRSRVLLEDALGSSITSFAYPHGYWTPELTRLVHRAGFRAACAAKNGLSHPRDDPLALARLVVSRLTGVDDLLRAVDGEGARVRTSSRSVQRTLWRMARRTVLTTRLPLPSRVTALST